jgi:alkaline phosphatase D
VAYPGWTITWSWTNRVVPGMHGYDHEFKDMHAIFYAAGPAFKKGYSQPSFQNIHLYMMMTEILDLSPAPNDGNLEEVKEMLESH